jgi:squalene synthase HpnC
MGLALAPQTPPAEPAVPVGRTRTTENFPVGSRLVRPELRPAVHAFYRFARAADDIADAPGLPPQQKIDWLDRLGAELDGAPAAPDSPVPALLDALAARGLGTTHPHTLLSAFRQDAVRERYASLAELEDYCRRSANPVGRFLIDLHGESVAAYPASDALCTALQVLNHLQDLQPDLLRLNRCYLPGDWLAAAGARAEQCAGTKLTPGLRRVVNQCLERCDAWNLEAAKLTARLRDRRFAAEAGTIVRLAHRLAEKLWRHDPLARRVKLTPMDLLLASGGALVAAYSRRAAA